MVTPDDKQSDNDNDDNFNEEFKESTWGKKVDGEFVIDGYKFRGRQPFKKAKEGLQKLLVKGKQGDVQGVKYKVFDARSKGIETEVEIEVSENVKMGVDSRGVANVKLYGPNKKKENSVLVTKNKESDIKFVSIIAIKIIKPLIIRILSVEDANNPSKTEKCDICEKTFDTIRELKGHNTKIHRKDKLIENEDINTDILWKEGNETEEEFSEEIVEEIIEERKFLSKCLKCKIQMEATRKYLLIQQIKKHKGLNCQNKKGGAEVCSECDFRTKDENLLKRHKRDKHEQMTASTSPPPKKMKISKHKKDKEIEENMEVEINEKIENNDNVECEEMDIEYAESEEQKRSKMMDEKILAKNKEQEEKEKLQVEKRKVTELEKKTKEENKKEEIRQSNKKRKQKAKDVKKKIRKQNSQRTTQEEIISKIPNIKPVPANCLHLVNDGDKVYTVPGNGACGPNAIAAHLFKDEIFGPKLRKKMNQFFARHWEKKYKFKTQCSKESPYVRKLGGGGVVSFTEPKKLIEYLNKSEEAEYMWIDSEDLITVSDMYQVVIKVITTKGEDDVNPTVNWVLPDEDMKDFAELKNVEIENCVLIHENDVHYNLIVPGDSELARLGSLSFRANIGPIIRITEEEEHKDINIHDQDDWKKSKEIKELQQELKKVKSNFNCLESEYKQCEAKLKNKTEEVEKLKIEIQDLKELSSLEKTLKESKL